MDCSATFNLNPYSSNNKCRGCATIKSDKSTCPPNCPLINNGCWGDTFHSAHWWKVTPFNLSGLLKEIRNLSYNQLTRLWEVGDFPGRKGVIDSESSIKIAHALKRVTAWGYTHYAPIKKNIDTLREISKYISLNLSANNLREADKYKDMGFDVTVLCHSKTPNFTFKTPNGVKVVMCPAQSKKVKNCASCTSHLLCHQKNRDYIIGFYSHGSQKKIVDQLVEKDLKKQIRIVK